MVLLFKNNLKIKSDNGDGKVHGSVLDRTGGGVDAPIPIHEVKIFNQDTNLMIQRKRSNRYGEYEFKSIDRTQTYFLISHYIDESKNGECADNITPQRDPIYDQVID